jgi:hypothetical protein
MGTRDPNVDAYIARSADFAKPILVHLREVVHAACPECEEAIKWSMPFFLYRGKLLCFMAAFKEHAGFGFFRAPQVMGKAEQSDGAMGSFGRLTKVSDLPSKAVLVGYLKSGMKLVDATVAQPKAKAKAKAKPQTTAKPKSKSKPKPRAKAGAKAKPRPRTAR